MKNPLISIVIPTYNVADYIERCIKSCLNQSYHFFEVIVVDDCGDDKSIDIAYQYSKLDDRIRIIHNEKNLGTYHSRKRGTQHASGDFILYLDPDDEITSDTLSVIYEYIKKFPNIDLLIFDTLYRPKHKIWNSKSKVHKGVFEKNIIKRVLSNKLLPYGTQAKVYSKKAVIESFKFSSISEDVRLVYGEDVLIFIGALLYTELAVSIKSKLYIYHKNSNSITNKQSTNDISQNILQLQLVQLFLTEFEKHPCYVNDIKCVKEKLLIDSLYLKKKIANNNIEYQKIMIDIMLRNKSWRVAIKLIIFYLTFSKVRR